MLHGTKDHPSTPLLQTLTLTLISLILGQKISYLILTILMCTWTHDKLVLYKAVLEKRTAARAEQVRQQRLRDINFISTQLGKRVIDALNSSSSANTAEERKVLEALKSQQSDIVEKASSGGWEDYYRDQSGNQGLDQFLKGTSKPKLNGLEKNQIQYNYVAVDRFANLSPPASPKLEVVTAPVVAAGYK